MKDPVGGNNCALAQTIARDHPDAPGNHIYMVMYTVIQLASSYYIYLIPKDSSPSQLSLLVCLKTAWVLCLYLVDVILQVDCLSNLAYK